MKKIYIFTLLLLAFIQAYASPPKASEVFKVGVESQTNAIEIKWNVKSGFFLYKNRIHVLTRDTDIISIGQINFPKPQTKLDSSKNNIEIYRNEVKLFVNILAYQPGEAVATLQYQGCADDGFCYPPEEKIIKLTIDTNLNLTNAQFEQPDIKEVKLKAEAAQDDDGVITDVGEDDMDDFYTRIFSYPKSFILLIFFGLGLLLSFTPCVLPMIPILSGIIVGHKNVSWQKAFFLSLSYVGGMSVTYAIAGAIVATLGQNLQIIMQGPIAIGIFSLVFVILALSMFDLYEIRLPQSLQNKIAARTRLKSSGHFMSAFIMGAFSILIISPCVTAPLIGVLSFIAQTGNIILGSLILFVLSLGMGTPLLLIGTGAGKLVPKAGVWMNIIKGFFGLLLLGLAISLISRLIYPSITMILWAALALFASIYLHTYAQKLKVSGKILEVISIMFLIYGILILIGASLGNINPWLPLKSEHRQIEEDKLVVTNLPDALSAINSNLYTKPIFIEFYATWCESCKHLEKTVFQDQHVKALLNDFVFIKIDISKLNGTKELLEHFNVVAPPTFIFLNPEGKEIKNSRIVGEISKEDLVSRLVSAMD